MEREHHRHYWNIIDPDLKAELEQMRLTEPVFIGQGWNHSVGSDCYGGYIVSREVIGRKIIWGLKSAATEFGPHGWVGGSQICFLESEDPTESQADKWIIQSGKIKGTEIPKFYFCDKNGKKFNGRKCNYSWNGACAYQDPSF